MANVLLVDPNRGFRVWNITEVWLGPDSVGLGTNVPNVDDMVLDWEKGFFRVVSVDVESIEEGVGPTYVPTLSLVDIALLSAAQSDSNGLSLYQPSISERAFYDNTLHPFTISLDDRYRVFGSDAVSMKLFKGTDVSAIHGEVISLRYDGNGNIVSENIELEAIDVTNPAIKRPLVINSLHQLTDGELVTAVIYNQTGGPSGIHRFIITSGSAIRKSSQEQMAIVNITLVTNMLDSTELDLVNIPSNTAITAGDFRALLHYSNGDTLNIPIDGIKCKLYGLANFNTSLSGVTGNLVLTYIPDNDEPVINANSPLLKSISTQYRMRVKTFNTSSSFKVYISPKYNSDTGKYQNTYWLSNLDYDLLLELDPTKITISSSDGGEIDYSPGGSIQGIRISIVMSDIFPVGYANFTFVQSFKILYGLVNNANDPWVIDYVGDGDNTFGPLVHFDYSDIGTNPISFKSGLSSKYDWLMRLYYNTHPLYNTETNLKAPDPTHFKLKYEDVETPEILVENWHLYHDNLNGHNWTEFDTVDVIWLLEDGESNAKKVLGVSPVMIFNTLV